MLVQGLRCARECDVGGLDTSKRQTNSPQVQVRSGHGGWWVLAGGRDQAAGALNFGCGELGAGVVETLSVLTLRAVAIQWGGVQW